MPQIRETLHINVEYFTGFEEGAHDVGYPCYVASCEELVAVTDGRTWNELMRNIREMIAASLEGEDTMSSYDLVPNPHIVINMRLPENYAGIA